MMLETGILSSTDFLFKKKVILSIILSVQLCSAFIIHSESCICFKNSYLTKPFSETVVLFSPRWLFRWFLCCWLEFIKHFVKYFALKAAVVMKKIYRRPQANKNN